MKANHSNLDDLVFMNRNKAYGAYMHRKNYSRYMTVALSIALGIFLSIISIPLIASYFSPKEILVGESYTYDPMRKIDPGVVKPPDVPKPDEPKVKEPAYSVPQVTIDTTELSDLAALMNTASNKPVGDTTTVTSGGGGGEIILPVDPPKTVETFIIVEEMPEFPGGEAGRVRFLKENMVYPKQAKETGIQGKVYIGFVVDETGQVVEARLLRGIGGGCDEEALRVINAMPKWKPGRQTGKAVRVQYSIDIDFRLE
jgi:protein TonB